MKWLFNTLLGVSVFCNQEDVFLKVNLHSYECGMFSVFNYVLGVLHEYETKPYAGIEIDFEDLGLYFDPDHGKNWWQYYHEPISLGNKENKWVKTFNIDEYSYHAFKAERNLSRSEAHGLIQMYFKLKESIQKKVDRFVEAYLPTPYLITVHYRGTDKKVEAPVVPYEKMIQAIQEHIQEKNLKDYLFFAASDDYWFIEAMHTAFPNRVVACDWHRSNDGMPLHTRKTKQYEGGEEALIDSLLLARGNILFRTSSNLSLWSTYFNPTMPVIELNQRNP